MIVGRTRRARGARSRSSRTAGAFRGVAGACFATVLVAAAGAGCAPAGWMFPGAYDSWCAPQGFGLPAGSPTIGVAAVGFESSRDDKAANLAKLEGIARRIVAERPDTDLIVFHEMCLSWLGDPADPAYFPSVAEPVPGPSTAAVGALAAELGCAIAFGLAEETGGARRNALVLAGPDGSLAVYWKRGLNDFDVMNGCQPGAAAAGATAAGVGATFFICSDYQSNSAMLDLARRPEPLVIGALATGTCLNPEVDFVAKALGKWTVCANAWGRQGDISLPGGSWIADPTGTVRARAAPGENYAWYRIGPE